MHKPVRIHDNQITCRCGWTSKERPDAKNDDDAWDEYDEHTMKE